MNTRYTRYTRYARTEVKTKVKRLLNNKLMLVCLALLTGTTLPASAALCDGILRVNNGVGMACHVDPADNTHLRVDVIKSDLTVDSVQVRVRFVDLMGTLVGASDMKVIALVNGMGYVSLPIPWKTEGYQIMVEQFVRFSASGYSQ